MEGTADQDGGSWNNGAAAMEGDDDGDECLETPTYAAGVDDSGAVEHWLPPGAEEEQTCFEKDFDESFHIPARLQGRSLSMVTAVNDFHFAMMNDFDRNEFYREALRSVVGPDKVVLEIGAGSGLLSMIAANEGAGRVVAIEASKDMVNVASQTIKANGMSDRIHLINSLSTDVDETALGDTRADVLVSEILGTLMLGEGALDYVSDARRRLLKPDATIIPACGTQYVTLIESSEVASITSVQGWGSFNLQTFNQLQDTVSCVFSKQYGFRMSTIDYRRMSDRISVIDVDFYNDEPATQPSMRRIRLRAKHTGIVHAVMLTWDVFTDRNRTRCMSTDPEATRNNFPRDMQWGQALQLIEDQGCDVDGTAQGGMGDGQDVGGRDRGPMIATSPKPYAVVEGELLDLEVRTSGDGVSLQFILLRTS